MYALGVRRLLWYGSIDMIYNGEGKKKDRIKNDMFREEIFKKNLANFGGYGINSAIKKIRIERGGVLSFF